MKTTNERLVDAAEEVLRAAHKDAEKHDKRFMGMPFVDIWTEAKKHSGEKSAAKSDGISDFYADLLQDPRFINVGNNKWRLREFVTFDEYKRIKGAMYGIENLERVEEENRTKAVPSTKGIPDVTEVEEQEEEMIEIISTDEDNVTSEVVTKSEDDGA